jgi:DNA polymerase III delta subunit
MNQVFVYCGDDIVSSRKAFLNHLEGFSKDGLEIAKIAGKELSLESLEMLSCPVSLFGEKRALAIESLLAGQKTKEKEKIIDKLALLSDCSVVIWEGKEFSKTDQLKYPKNFIFKNFKLPQVLFSFLDALSPGNTGANLKYLHEVLITVEASYLFLMLVRQIRLLILAQNEKALAKLAPWQRSKLVKQAKAFPLPKLLDIYKKLLQIDYQQKTSSLSLPLAQTLELLITEI